jgi:NAD(P)-dependent dehydrogenase (short-subunit alcohol dehydrogenase family)
MWASGLNTYSSGIAGCDSTHRNLRREDVQIADRTFLVTGGASGLGAGTVRRLVSRGASVVIADRSIEAGEALAGELGSRATFIATDVTSAESGQAAVEGAMQRFGRLDGLVNCAGILGAARIVGRDGPHDLELFRKVIEVNLIGTFNMLRLAAAAMSASEPNAEGERGVIVNTASASAFEGQIGQAAYAASKGGVVSLSLPAARELARFGIRVVAVAPGIFETAMMQGTTDALRSSLVSQAPFPARFGRPEEFAQLVEQIIENPMLNGTVLRLDGALRMGPK